MKSTTQAIAMLIGTLGVVACAKNARPADVVGVTETTRAEVPRTVTAEEIRAVLLEERPGAAAQIRTFDIRNDDGIITIRGTVDDEATHSDLVNRVRSLPDVRGVRDEVNVTPRDWVMPERPNAPTPGTEPGVPPPMR